MKASSVVVTAVALLATAALVAWWWQQQQPHPEPAPSAQPLPVQGAAPAPVASAPPAIVHPIEAVASAASQADGQPWTLANAAERLFGRKAVLQLLQTDDLARRVVATVDNLGREQATSRLWPLNPAPDRFRVRTEGGLTLIDPDNAQRYAAHLRLLESVDLSLLASAYVQLYPELQRAYEDLGHPGRPFNDRLVQVIDLLLATPEFDRPLAVHMPTLNSPVQPARPWVLYELADPALQPLAAGQKLLLRMGPAHERRVKQWLRAWRRVVASAPPAR